MARMYSIVSRNVWNIL